MITYKEETHVYLDGKKIGTIKQTIGGLYFYLPKGQKTGGEEFASLAGCKYSLEAE